VIKRAEWERLVNTVRPNLPPSEGRRLAQEYATFAALANAGRKAGLDKTSEVQERLRLARMQILANAYTQDLQKKYSQLPAPEIENYYNNNKAQFEEATLKRIYVPKPAPVEGKPVDEAAAKAMAQKIRDRAAAGEDFDKLQKEAFEGTGNKGTPPNTDIGEKRRGTLPPKHEEEVFKLKPGEVSPTYEEPSGFFIYKVVKTGVAPLDQVKAEIQRTLESEKLRTAMEQVRESVKPVFNEAYFGPVQPAAGPAAPHAGQQAGRPAGATAAPSQPTPAAPAQPASPATGPSTNQPPTSTPSPK
jgi:parvulin-like peptidyl-prolyl isomerase